MDKRALSLGVMGAGGAVGAELLRLMRASDFPVDRLVLFGASGSAGDVHEYGGDHHVVRPFSVEAVEDLDVVVFAAPAEVVAAHVPQVIERGVAVLDASSAFREAEDVPLIVGPVNREALDDFTGIVASPDAFTTGLALVLDRFVRKTSLESVEIVGLSAAASAGRQGMTELSAQVVAILNQRPWSPTAFPTQIAFNVTPWLPDAGGDAEISLEDRVERELRRVVPALPEALGLSLAQVPVFCGHSASLTLRFERPMSQEDAAAVLRAVPGIDLLDERGVDDAPTSVDAAERDEVLVGRLRVDKHDPAILRLWIAFDNLRVTARNLLLVLEALRDEAIV